MRGIRDERELVNKLWQHGFAVLRAPASGSATKMMRPDIIAGNAQLNLQLAIEVKTTWDKVIYITRESIDQLVTFAKRFGCQPILAIKFKGFRKVSWIFIPPKKLKITDAGNYKITRGDALHVGKDLDSFARGKSLG